MPSSSKRLFLGNDFEMVPEQEAVYVAKIITKEKYKGLMENEVKWLKHLQGFSWVPRFVNSENNEIMMTYVGAPVCVENLPKDWRAQMDGILNDLKSAGCFHNDIKNEELLIKDGKIHLIDFQHATSTREEFKAKKVSGECECRMSWTDHDAMLTILAHLEKRKNAYK